MRVYTKINGELRAWQSSGMEPEEAIKALRDELGIKHKATILALVKY